MFSESESYERFIGRWSRRIAPQFVRFAQVGAGDTVLDVGCGTGAATFATAVIPSVRATGVDSSSAYIQHAQQHALDDRTRFEVGDAQQLPFPDATFDRTLSLLVLNFVPDPVGALREMIRVTRPNGVVAAAVWEYGDGMKMLRTFWDEAVALDPAAAPRDERHMPLCGHGELADLWRTHGLRGIKDAPVTIESRFESFDDYWQPFECGQGPAGSYTASLPDSARQALRRRLRDRLLEGQPDGKFTLTARAWAVRGAVPPG